MSIHRSGNVKSLITFFEAQTKGKKKPADDKLADALQNTTIPNPKGSRRSGSFSKRSLPSHNPDHPSKGIAEFVKKHTETFRDFTMLVKTTLHNILRLDRLADVSYSGAAMGASGAEGFASVAGQLDMYASASNLLANGISCFLKGVNVYRYHKVKKALKNSGLTGKERKLLERKKLELKEEVKSAPEWIKLGAGTLASISYFSGSVIALAAPAEKAAAAALGSLGFGVLYAISKGVELRQNYKQYKGLKKEIKEYQNRCNGMPEGSLKEIYKMKADSLRQKLLSKTKLNMVQNTLDILVGMTATAAGITALIPPANVVAIPLVAALAASLACKAGIAAYRNLRSPASRHRSKLALQKKLLQVEIFFTRGSKRKEFQSKLNGVRTEYVKARAAEQTSRTESSVLAKISDFMQDASHESLAFKTSIAEELGFYDDNGDPDPTLLTEEHVAKWLGQ